MREIRFRAWDEGRRRMYPVASIVPDVDASIDKTVLLADFDAKQTWIVDRNIVDVMQSTCLRDKNHREIYEGDIVKHDLWGVGRVVYEVEGAGFRVVGTEHDVNLAHHHLERTKVIGNIYENPELLT